MKPQRCRAGWVAAVQESGNGMARPRSSAYLLEEAATPWREPTVKLQFEEMLRAVEEAMSQVIDWWGDLPQPMKEAIEQFRTQLGSAIDSVVIKRALDRQVHETDRGKDPA